MTNADLNNLRSEIERFERAAEALTNAVVEARTTGASWAEIGDVFGVTRQSAHATWARTVRAIMEDTRDALSGTISVGR